MKTWKFNSDKEDKLKRLTEIVSPSMNEVPMAALLRDNWKFPTTQIDTDVMGNVHTTLPGELPIHIGLVAHIDTVCIQITNILHNGHLAFRTIGLTPHVLLGQSIRIITRNGTIDGVIGFDTTSQYGQPKGLIGDDLWLDIGVSSKEEAMLLITIGDLAVLKPSFTVINEQYISATGLDDRVGIFIISECLQWFAENGSPLHLHVIGSVQEEIGLRGAMAGISKQQLNACIIVDVDYATDMPVSHANQMGELIVGKGVGMHKKADNNPILQQLMYDTALNCKIPIQTTLGRYTYGGTDASAIQLQAGGIATANINIPCRYMHSPIELCHKSDIEHAVLLLINLIYRIAELNKKSFIPGID